MKTFVSFYELASDLVTKFTIGLKSEFEQYKAITLRNVIDGSVLMACVATFLLSKYQFFTLARITRHLIIYAPTEKLIMFPSSSVLSRVLNACHCRNLRLWSILFTA